MNGIYDTEKLGIIAGAGELPVLVAQSAAAQGRKPIIIQITKTDEQRFSGIPCEIYSYGVGQIQKITQKLLDLNVKELVIIGKIEPSILLRPFQVDATALKILAQNRKQKPAALVSAVLEHFQNTGLSILKQDHFLSHLLPDPGILTKRNPNDAQWDDIKTGIATARQIANMDIGQTVVLKNQIILAIEAIEGTDTTIQRGGDLGGKGVVVAKAASENHDFRIDVPTVGMQTLETLHAVKGSVLAVEARRTFVMEPETLFEQADRWKISIVAVE
ncbi:MAG: UDP-2,3-diacylglucosamine diphosphatase LpxI [Candidatus Poribacteria bacterium]|nr:UDP-2,3-diacylglucosamine diphosphatase LpxI [Candidatus Poribacteria bacterium]